jgi:hypothetical protein
MSQKILEEKNRGLRDETKMGKLFQKENAGHMEHFCK